MAFLASSRPKSDNTIAADESTISDSEKTDPAFDLPDIREQTLAAGRFSGELKSGAAHLSAIRDNLS